MKTLIKSLIVATVVANFGIQSAKACTGIVLHTNDGATVPARTMEFSFDVKSNIAVIPAGTMIEKLAIDEKNTGGTYKAKYGFTGATALDMPIVVDGVNEQGLYFGAFYFKGIAEFDTLTDKNKAYAISSEELGNYILSQFKSVDEIKSELPKLTVVGTYVKEINDYAPFHYAVTDRNGQSIVIEYTNRGLTIFENTANVVTNNPTYDWHLTNLNNYVGLTAENRAAQKVGQQMVSPFGEGTGLFGLPGDHTSPSRFVRATAFANTALPAKDSDTAVFEAFHILNHFDIPKGSIREEINGEVLTDYTVWTSVVDTQKSIYYYKTYSSQSVEKIDLAKALKGLKTPKIIKMESGFKVRDRARG